MSGAAWTTGADPGGRAGHIDDGAESEDAG